MTTHSAGSRAPIARVGLVVKPNAAAAAEAATRLHRRLVERDRQVVVEESVATWLNLPDAVALEGADFAERVDLVVVLGGDGTLIHAVDLVSRTPGDREVPILGVNLGSLGFMTEVPLPEMLGLVDGVLDGNFRVERRIKLKVSLERDGKHLVAGEVLNDAVINKGAMARIADLECFVDGRTVTTYKADGVIVATPTGSTAYSLSAAGPIVMPTLEAMVITPICPHTLTQRPLVIPNHSEVDLVLRSDNGEVYLTLDGHTGYPMRQGDRVVVRRSARPTVLIKNPNIDFYGLLRAKLHWGER
jgi:NAD+ kinase